MPTPTRRELLQSGLALGTAALAGCTFGFGSESDCGEGRTVHETDTALPQSAAWPTYRHDAANTGHNPSASGPPAEPTVCWRYSSCTEAESGVAVHGGRTYAGGAVVDGETGEGAGGEWHGHMSTPTVHDGTLYVSAHDLEARNPATGELQWTFETDVDAGALPPPAVVDGTAYVPGSIDDPTVYAVRTDDRRERWRYETETDVDAPVAVVEDTVYVRDESNAVYAIDAASGDERWAVTPALDLGAGPPVGAGDLLVFGTAEGGVLALERADGSVAWQQQFERPDFQSSGAVAVAEGTVCATGREGAVVALEAESGRLEWSGTTDADALGPPTVADGTIYAGATVENETGAVLALDAESGERQWRVDTREVLFGDYVRFGVIPSPVVVDEYVFAATEPGDLYAIGAA
jgi:outer membrane protein assembly factor BamB